MSARDDYSAYDGDSYDPAMDEIDHLRAKVKVYVEVCDERDALRAQNEGLAQIGLRLTETIDRMQRWKTEATTVIAAWDEVWNHAGCPGVLGSVKSAAVRDEITRLRSLNTALMEHQVALHETISTLLRAPEPGDPAQQEMRRAPDEVNEADARAIRESPYSSYDLAPTYGVSPSTIQQIRRGPFTPDEVNDQEHS